LRDAAVVPAQFPALAVSFDGAAPADVRPVGTDRESARAAGFAAGFAAGARAAARAAESTRRRAALDRQAAQQEAAARLEDALGALAAATQAVAERAAPVLAEAERTLHECALALARTVVGVELRDDDTAAAAVLARVREGARLADTVTVRLNPDVMELLAGVRAVPAGVVLVADPSLARGEAVAEHAEGWLDGRIDEALARARAALDGAS
jgi:flagellar assembly protein FliH